MRNTQSPELRLRSYCMIKNSTYRSTQSPVRQLFDIIIISEGDPESKKKKIASTYFEENNSVLAEDTHKVSHQQSVGNRYLLDKARHFLLSAWKDIRRDSRWRGRGGDSEGFVESERRILLHIPAPLSPPLRSFFA